MTGTADQGQLGAGFQSPNDSASEVNQIAFAVKQVLKDYDFMMVVKVVAVHAGSGSPPGPTTVDVQPLVSQIDGNGNVVQHGTVPGIPVRRIQNGGWTIVCDPSVGDIGYVKSADRDISKVKASPGIAPPGSSRLFNIADGIYEGAILTAPTSAYLWLKPDGTFVLVDKAGFGIKSDGAGNGIVTGNLIVNGNLQLSGTLQAPNGSTYAGNIHTTGTITGDTDVVAGGISGKTHVHGGVTVGSGNTAVPH